LSGTYMWNMQWFTPQSKYWRKCNGKKGGEIQSLELDRLK